MIRKAQMHTQIFTYVIAIVIASLILLYGYKAISGFQNRGEAIALLNLENSLDDTVNTISKSFERVKIQKFDVPGGYVQICILDLDKQPGSICIEGNPNFNPVVCESWKDPLIKENIFLVDNDGITTKLGQGYIGNIIMDNPGCFDVINGEINLKFTGSSNNKAKVEFV